MLTQLKHIGLSENEAKVYLAMLELGPSPVLEIAAKAGINRPTAYAQIESLKKMGLVSMQTKGKKQLYIAEDPDQLEFLIEREKKGLEQKQDELKNALPELKELFDATEDKPLVRFFEGIAGIQKVQKDFLKTKNKKISGIFFRDDVYNKIPNQHEYYRDRVKRGIRAKLIYSSQNGPVPKENDKGLLVESRYVPTEKFPKGADITIYDDKVAITTLRNKVSCTVIENKEIADTFQGIFNLLWESLGDKQK